MSEFVEKVRALIRAGDVRTCLRRWRLSAQAGGRQVSAHGYDELAEDGLTAREVLRGVPDAVVVEEYPNYPKGPCALFLQKDRNRAPIHVIWGIPRGHDNPVVLITAYRPDPGRWDQSFTRRR